MATLTKDDILDAIANMTVLELSELLKDFEEKFGVTAAAPVAAGIVVLLAQAVLVLASAVRPCDAGLNQFVGERSAARVFEVVDSAAT